MANKKTNHETKTAQADIDKMSEQSGEDGLRQPPKYPLSSLKMNGRDGIFRRTILENGELQIGDDGKALLEDMGKEISGIILKVRKTFVRNDPETQLFTSEIGNAKNEQISVFSKSENVKGGFTIGLIFQGTAAQVKERFPNISFVQVIYFLVEDEIMRLKIKGKGLGELFAYWKEFASDEHIFEFVTNLKVKKEKNKFGTFYVNIFSRGKRVQDLMPVQKAIEEVHKNLSKIEDFYKDRKVELNNTEEMEITEENEVISSEADLPKKKEEELLPPEKEQAEPTKKDLEDAGLE